MSSPSPRSSWSCALAAGAALLWIGACTTEEVVMVTVASVQVVPEAVRAVEGERVQLSATVVDEHDERLSPSGMEWSSDDPSVATVDERGLVEAHAAGSATVRATYRGVSGATDVRVLRGPFVSLARTSLTMFAGPGASPDPEVVAVTNGGAGDLTDLSVAITHPDGQDGGWLSAELSGRSTPAELRLSARSEGLDAGMYEAEARLSSASGGAPASVGVTLSVAGFDVRETGGGTRVRESGTTDRITAVLSARPSAAVVLSVSSADPGEVSVSPGSLRFTPSDWSTPQTVTVRGVGDPEDDGDQAVDVIVSVNVGQSHDVFEGLADRRIRVVNEDDDEPVPPRVVASHTGQNTRVSEAGTYDTIRVRLSARPASDVVVSASSANTSEVMITSAGTIRFTPTDWSVPRNVIVRGIDDSADDGDRNVTVTISVVNALSADAYDGQSARVTVRNDDNEPRGGRGGGGDDDDDDDDNSGPGGGGGGGGGGRGGRGGRGG